jgi:hypothetical protein
MTKTAEHHALHLICELRDFLMLYERDFYMAHDQKSKISYFTRISNEYRSPQTFFDFRFTAETVEIWAEAMSDHMLKDKAQIAEWLDRKPPSRARRFWSLVKSWGWLVPWGLAFFSLIEGIHK